MHSILLAIRKSLATCMVCSTSIMFLSSGILPGFQPSMECRVNCNAHRIVTSTSKLGVVRKKETTAKLAILKRLVKTSSWIAITPVSIRMVKAVRTTERVLVRSDVQKTRTIGCCTAFLTFSLSIGNTTVAEKSIPKLISERSSMRA